MSQDQAKQFIEQASQSLQSGQVEQALALIDQALALNERDSEAHILRGICLAQTNRPQEATEAFKYAIGLSPYNAKAYYNLAVHYYSLGQKHEALNMAQEAVGVDPRHSSAKELVTRLNAEMRAVTQAGPGVNEVTTQQQPMNPADALGGMSTPPSQSPQAPMAPPPGGMAPPPSMGQPQQPAPTPPGGVIEPPRPVQQPGQMPPGGPYPPQGPGQYPQGAPYMRSGYDMGPQHTLEFVEKMGGTWVTIGWILVALWFAISAFNIFSIIPAMMQAMQAGAGASPTAGMTMGNPVMSILGYAIGFGSLIWMILDLVDRKGNWLWFVGTLCCCGPIIMPIYILAGRK